MRVIVLKPLSGIPRVFATLFALGILMLMGIPMTPSAYAHTQSFSNTHITFLEEYDPEPLHQRTPLFLIHGIGGANDMETQYKWDRFLNYARTSPAFTQRFKIYLFRYDTRRSVSDISSAIRSSLRTFIINHDNPHFRVLAFSEGGLVYRNVMQDPIIYTHTDKIITVASPFHGSPLANQDWLKEQMKESSPFSMVRLTRKISLAIAKIKHPSFQDDFRWDDLDDTANLTTTPFPHYAMANHNNVITYGSYFGVGKDIHKQLFQTLDIHQTIPKEDMSLKNRFNKHAVFRLVQQTLTAIPLHLKKHLVANRQVVPRINRTTPPKKALPSNPLTPSLSPTTAVFTLTSIDDPQPTVPMLIYNDGISPISSSLWLGRYTGNHTKVQDKVQRTWEALRSLKGTQKARLFHSMDHANWMEGAPLTSDIRLKDLLNPEEPSRSVFEWFIYDLTS